MVTLSNVPPLKSINDVLKSGWVPVLHESPHSEINSNVARMRSMFYPSDFFLAAS